MGHPLYTLLRDLEEARIHFTLGRHREDTVLVTLTAFFTIHAARRHLLRALRATTLNDAKDTARSRSLPAVAARKVTRDRTTQAIL